MPVCYTTAWDTVHLVKYLTAVIIYFFHLSSFLGVEIGPMISMTQMLKKVLHCVGDNRLGRLDGCGKIFTYLALLEYLLYGDTH